MTFFLDKNIFLEILFLYWLFVAEDMNAWLNVN